MPVPVISVTDLYHPHQDPGDNFDLIAAFALPEVDLRAVVLDCSEPFRQPVAGPLSSPALYPDPTGPRDPGFIPVTQLNYAFDRCVPAAVGPFRQMRDPLDPMTDTPRFQQQGIELILETLRASDEPVHVLSFGSARTIAAAYNRAPDVFERNGAVIELAAGASSTAYLEWNVALDPLAIVRLLSSPLTVNIYPCATENGPFDCGPFNTFYSVPDLRFIADMDPQLRRYLHFAFGRSTRMDYLRALDVEWHSTDAEAVFEREHKIWETQVWMQVSGRILARTPGERWRIAEAGDVGAGEETLTADLVPCAVDVNGDGLFSFALTADNAAAKRIYHRADPLAEQDALREALPDLYRSFTTAGVSK
ncbi:MAG TPA: hypothetical protein VGK19_17340 [Capsulimonadaceae bacterium]|jgi:hypothetical protein